MSPVKRAIAFVAAVAVIALFATYRFGPSFFNFDDGPFYARVFAGDVGILPLHSKIPLKRFGSTPYTFEVRLLDDAEPAVFVLRTSEGRVGWARRPVHGRLGRITLNEKYSSVTWYGGWVVSISPEFQESGDLYLGPFGGFRFFFHSW